MDLSVLIPARNEMWLRRTVEDVLAHATRTTEVIVILDGAWPDPALEVHPRVTLVYHPESVGQRAATNEAARIAQGKYVMKLDAHCSVAQGFDAALIDAAEELGDDVTQVPAQKNLHAFDWVCDNCGARTYQGPTPSRCECTEGAPGNTVAQPGGVRHATFRREIVWKPRRGVTTTAWRFDSEPKFQYWGEYSKRPEAQGTDFPETMSSLGACFFMSRRRFDELGGLDEKHGSWGSFGIEIGCKSWLSGGRQVTNRRTWFSHMFRTQGGDFSFPYPLSGKDQERARQRARSLWFDNAWPGQKLPLSWLLDRFWPVPGWSDEARAEIAKAGVAFTASRLAGVSNPPGASLHGELPGRTGQLDAGPAASQAVLVGSGECVASEAVGLAAVVSPLATDQVGGLRNETQVIGIAARRIVADEMVEHASGREVGDEPGVHEPVGEDRSVRHGSNRHAAVAVVVGEPAPDPASTRAGHVDLPNERGDSGGAKLRDRERIGVSHDSASYAESRSGASGVAAPPVPPSISKCVVWYTDNRLDETLALACRRILLRAAGKIPVVGVSLAPLQAPHFDRNIVLSAERGYLTMFRQILAGLEAANGDVVFLAEHDLAYHPSHFDFVPPKRDVIYYNTNVWKVDAATGRALHYDCRQTSGLCAYRDVLLDHYRKRVAKVEAGGFSRRMGFEPGTHRRAERVDDLTAESWQSPHPNVDIRHGFNLTESRWSQEQFRDKRNCRGWVEADEVPGWGVTKGRFTEFLSGI